MFILYALVAGLLMGRLLGGRLENLGALSFRWTWVAIAGLAAQVALFSPPVNSAVGQAGAPLYVASTAAVFGFVLANLRVSGMPIVALGAGLNLLAIAVNGGTMPASRAALEAIGAGGTVGYINSRELAAPALAPLGDVFALPTWLPFANVFSVGDLLIGVGVLVLVVAGMRPVPADLGPPPVPVDAGPPPVRADLGPPPVPADAGPPPVRADPTSARSIAPVRPPADGPARPRGPGGPSTTV